MKRIGWTGLIGCLILSAGCSIYQNDRQYVWDSEYQNVRSLYDRCGSIEVVEQVLREHKWTRGQINEARYRLSQDYYLDENGMPRGIDRPQPVVSSRTPVQLGVGPGARD